MNQKKVSKVKSNKLETSTTEEVIIDGALQKIKNNLIYIQSEIKGLKLTKETVFSEITFSVKMKVVKEKKIKLTDFQEEDQISIVVKGVKSQKVVSAVRRIIVLES